MKKLNKKGFTLVELLAVIAILAILMLLITPNVLKIFTDGKKDTFITQCQSLYKVAEQEYMTESFNPNGAPGPYCSEKSSNCGNQLDYKGSGNFQYYIQFSNDGNITKFLATDGTYKFESTGEEKVNISDIKEDGSHFGTAKDNNKYKMTCTGDSSCTISESGGE